ncbi:MAG: glycosyltransferase [Weeksellaceae bacterium]
MQKLKIAQVIDQLGVGGAERVCLNLVNLFASMGYEVKLIVLDKKGPLFDLVHDQVKVVVLNKNKSKLKAYKKFTKEIDGYKIVHIHMRQTYRFAQKAFLIFGGKKPVILHDHYGKIAINQRVPLFYRTIFKPDVYIGCTTLLTNWAVQKLKVKQENTYFIKNFVIQEPQNNFIKKNNTNGLVLVANLKPVKNHAFAIQLAHRLGKDLTIYCSKTGGDYYQELLSIISKLDYHDHVHFITGCINVQKELCQYEAGILSSFSEGDALVLVEYLAQGLPVLTYNVGESVKIIESEFPEMVQTDFDLNKWEDSFYKVQKVDRGLVQNIFHKYYPEERYLKQYLSVYNNIPNKE